MRTPTRPLQSTRRPRKLGYPRRVLRSDTARVAASTEKITKPKPKKRRARADPWAPKRKPNPNPKPRAPPPTHFTCRICIEEQTSDQFTKWIPPRSIGRWPATLVPVPHPCIPHLARNPQKKKIDPVCVSCIGRNMSARLDTLGARQVGVGCLEPGCTVLWPHESIMRYMPDGEPLEKYNMEMFNVWKADMSPKLFTCLSSDCEAVGLTDTYAPGFPQVTCHSCSSRACAQCNISWHKDVTCAEYSAKNINKKMTDPEKDILKLMQAKDGRRCPNCQLVIEKDGGCNSM